MDDNQLKKQYAKEPWGKLLIEMGWEPFDTESSAREVAGYAAGRIAGLEERLEVALNALKLICFAASEHADIKQLADEAVMYLTNA